MVRNDVTLPRQVLEQYNRQYNNSTYRAFRNALTERLPNLPRLRLACEVAIMNLLIDASFGRCSPETNRSVELRLIEAIAPLGDDLLELAQAHLNNFTAR